MIKVSNTLTVFYEDLRLYFCLHFRSEDEQDLRAELVLLKSRMKELEHNIKTCNNIPLKEKFKKDLKDIKQQIKDKEGGV